MEQRETGICYCPYELDLQLFFQTERVNKAYYINVVFETDATAW